MARGVNKVILVGGVKAKPEIKNFQDGTSYTRLDLATNKEWKDKEGKPQSKTEWHRVVLFGGLADVAVRWLDSGSQIYLEGELQTRKWQDKDGIDRWTTEIRANEMTMLGSSKNNENSPTASNSNSSSVTAEEDINQDSAQENMNQDNEPDANPFAPSKLPF